MLMAGSLSTHICRTLGISIATLMRACIRDHNVNFDTYRQQKKAEGANALERKAYQMAIQGDRTMLIFLLKNLCGYADRTISDTNVHLPDEVGKRAEQILNKVAEAAKDLEYEDDGEGTQG